MLIALIYRHQFVKLFGGQRFRRRFLKVVKRPSVDIHFRWFILANSLRYHRRLIEYARLIFCCYTLAERSYIRRLGVLLVRHIPALLSVIYVKDRSEERRVGRK